MKLLGGMTVSFHKEGEEIKGNFPLDHTVGIIVMHPGFREVTLSSVKSSLSPFLLSPRVIREGQDNRERRTEIRRKGEGSLFLYLAPGTE